MIKILKFSLLSLLSYFSLCVMTQNVCAQDTVDMGFPGYCVNPTLDYPNSTYQSHTINHLVVCFIIWLS